MKQNTYINEEDLFNYVFYPKNLSEGKIHFIEENIFLFSRELEYFEQLMQNKSTSDCEIFAEKLFSNISNGKVIVLYPYNPKIKEHKFILAAASVTLDRHIDFFSFTDDANQFLVSRS